MTYRIFISSVQREFAKERKALADYIRKDAILGKFFDVFLFEEVPAQERRADHVYLGEVDRCDVYLGILGRTYGHEDTAGVSATEREYERACKRHKTRLCFVGKTGGPPEPKQAAFVARVEDDVVRRGFADYDGLRTGVYAALAKFLEDKGLISVLPFDASKTAGVELKDLSVAKMRDFIRTAREKRQFPLPVNAAPQRLLTALELMDDEGRILNPAVLLFGKRPQKFFPSSEVKCAQFYADRVSKPMADHQIYAGDVFELVDQATRFAMTHVSNWVGTRETGDTAEVPTKFELPYDAVKEAVVNAVVHRDYASLASVQVMLFRDRLEVWSPGTLPRGMTVPKLFKAHQSLPVNPLLARAMYLKGYIEKTGTGTEDMIAKCAEWGVAAPEWIEEDDDFRVVLKRPVGTAAGDVTTQQTTQQNFGKSRDWNGAESRDWNGSESRDRNGGKPLKTSRIGLRTKTDHPAKSRDRNDGESRDRKRRELIVALIGHFPTIKQSEMAKAARISVKGVEKIVARLKAEGIVSRTGGKRFGHWVVSGKDPVP